MRTAQRTVPATISSQTRSERRLTNQSRQKPHAVLPALLRSIQAISQNTIAKKSWLLPSSHSSATKNIRSAQSRKRGFCGSLSNARSLSYRCRRDQLADRGLGASSAAPPGNSRSETAIEQSDNPLRDLQPGTADRFADRPVNRDAQSPPLPNPHPTARLEQPGIFPATGAVRSAEPT